MDLTIDVQFPGRKVYVKVWQARVGHVTIYLLDTDLPENGERERTSRTASTAAIALRASSRN